MSVTQNIIDALKNQGAIPDLAQLNLISRLVDLKIYKSNPLTKLFIKQKTLVINIKSSAYLNFSKNMLCLLRNFLLYINGKQ